VAGAEESSVKMRREVWERVGGREAWRRGWPGWSMRDMKALEERVRVSVERTMEVRVEMLVVEVGESSDVYRSVLPEDGGPMRTQASELRDDSTSWSSVRGDACDDLNMLNRKFAAAITKMVRRSLNERSGVKASSVLIRETTGGGSKGRRGSRVDMALL